MCLKCAIIKELKSYLYSHGLQRTGLVLHGSELYNGSSRETPSSPYRSSSQGKIRFNHIGNAERLSSRAREVLKWATNLTEKNGPLTFNLAFNYGGRDDIMHSLRLIIAQKMSSDIITEAMIEKHLYTGGLPDVDLLFRSGGEKRISNFMLWQISSAFIYFTDTYCLILERMKLMKPLNNFTIVNLTGQTGPDPEA